MTQPFIQPDPEVRKGRDLPDEISVRIVRRDQDGLLEGQAFTYISNTVRDYKPGESGYVLLMDGKAFNGHVTLQGPDGEYTPPPRIEVGVDFAAPEQFVVTSCVGGCVFMHDKCLKCERTRYTFDDLADHTTPTEDDTMTFTGDTSGPVATWSARPPAMDAFEALSDAVGRPMRRSHHAPGPTMPAQPLEERTEGRVYTLKEAIEEATLKDGLPPGSCVVVGAEDIGTELPPGAEIWSQPPVDVADLTGAQFTTAGYGDLSDIHSVPGGFASQVLNTVRTRGSSYGTPDENHQLTADFFSSYFSRKWAIDVTFTAEDVCVLNVLQKLSRNAFATKDDNWLDIAGYAENVAMLRRDQRK